MIDDVIGHHVKAHGFVSGPIEWLDRMNQEVYSALSYAISSATHAVEITPSQRALHVVERFGEFAHQIRHRHKDGDVARATINFKDEYDVQDALHALLKIDFSDADREEWTPRFAGASSRTDLILPSHGTFVETKMTRPGRDDRTIGDELLLDIARYPEHPKCKVLICAVYDPDRHIKNPARLITDLEAKSTNQLTVFVRVIH